MEWWVIFLGFCAVLMAALLSGIPVAFAFIFVNILGVYFFMGGTAGWYSLIHSLRSSVGIFTLIPIPLFILMGEVLFFSGIASRILDVFDMWLARLPGRLSLVAVGSGTLFAAMSGSSLSTTAMLASLLAPDMMKRGYNTRMILGPIMGGGLLAVIIPPSILAVIFASIGGIDVGKLLIAGVVPGLVLSFLFCCYIIGACLYNPSLVPRITVTPMPLSKKLLSIVQAVLPAAIIIFLVLGTIFAGVCTPTEASALGALGCYILAAAYKKLNWGLIKASVASCVRTTVMILIIVTGSIAFSQVLAFTGATRGLCELAGALPIAPVFVLIAMIIVLLFLGCWIDQISMIMIAVPIFIPIAKFFEFELIWVGILLLLSIELGLITPPFGMSFFVVKGSVPADITMEEIYRSGLPFVLLGLVVIALILVFPSLANWLPGFM
jgi:tripartite ATP-independent transporter DctM subunit